VGLPAPLTGVAVLAIAAAAARAVPGRAGCHEPQDPPASKPRAEAGPSQGPGPRKPLAGLSGFECVSTLVYPAAPDRPHQLKATYSFPDRARWQISAKQGAPGERSLQYRFGEAVYRVPPDSGDSELCAGEDRSQVLLQIELRRALMLYPDGFVWKDDGAERRAVLADLGSLRARAGSDGRPTEIGDAGPDGKAIDVYKSIRWREIGGRAWPASMELWHGGELVWNETVESVDVAARYVDSYFVPPDRRERSPAEPDRGEPRNLDIPECCSLRIEIPKGTGWSSALEDLERRRAEWTSRLAERKLELEGHATIELSREAEPAAFVLRLASVPETPPPGFQTTGPRRGLAVAVRGLAEVTAARVGDLRKAIPEKSAEGAAYVRFDPRDGEKARVVIVLPYSPGR
jgi:hypothetical protein